MALAVFQHQANNNKVYNHYLSLLNKHTFAKFSVLEIPFLPIVFFKSNKVVTGNKPTEIIFESSGTTGQLPSRHYITDQSLYIHSFLRCFELFFGKPSRHCILALLPSYLERKHSSLVFMADRLIKESNHPLSGFFLNDYNRLNNCLKTLESEQTSTILLGVSFALLEFAEKFPLPLKNTIIMETGGMKGRRDEITRAELHELLKKAFGVSKVYSEYGMTELLSQAYSTGDGIFQTPPWMKVLIRNPYDPFDYLPTGQIGGINIIDLANINSCAFIQTDDLGKIHADGTFEVLGRMDNAELRGCNLMLEQGN